MTIAEWVQIGTLVVAILSGLFAVIKWKDQRERELAERRLEQYWKFLDISVETPKLAKQKTALLLLKRYPEFEHVCAA